MNITYLTYARVAVGATPGPPRFRPKGDGVESFLGDHINSLFAMAKKPDATPPGRFAGDAARGLFRDLQAGSASDFLTAAYALTRRLIGKMNGTTAAGLFVCLRADTPDGRVAGVLKLEVVTPNGAVLRELDSGETELAAVKDLLDAPGKLHKGALVASWLPDGEVLCGDRVAQAVALYFPNAFDIRIFSRPSAATKAFFDAVDECAGSLVAEIAAAWPAVRPGSPREVLAELARKVPGLTASVQADIAERLESLPRPVALLDTRRAVTETYKVGGISVSGPIDEMRSRVSIGEAPGGGGWRIVVESAERPVASHL